MRTYPPVPAGYRVLKTGEVLGKNDLFFSTDGFWKPWPFPGVRVLKSTTIFIRKQSSRKRKEKCQESTKP